MMPKKNAKRNANWHSLWHFFRAVPMSAISGKASSGRARAIERY